MGEKNLWSKLGLIVLIVGMSVWQIIPPEKQLKGGIDLVGGASLLFEIDDSGLDAADKIGLAERVASILKERVDPQGTRNLVWRPIGQNRLEIQMPLQKRNDENRRAYEEARNALAATNITEGEIKAALQLPADQRSARFAEMSSVVKSRAPLFEKLAAASDKYQQMRAQTTQPEGAVAEEMDRLLIERNRLIEDLLATNLDPRLLADLLELGAKSEARASGIAAIKDKHKDLTGLIDNLIASHDAWSLEKGVLDDTADLMRLLRGAGVLEFRILAQQDPSNPSMTAHPRYAEPIQKYIDQLARYGPRQRPGDNYAWFRITQSEQAKDLGAGAIVSEYAGSRYVLAHATPDMSLVHDNTWSLKSARPGRDQMGRMNIQFELASRGKFGELTGNNINRPLAIFMDNEAISAATINSRIDDRGEISGSFTPQYVQYIVNTLEAGALPARLKELPLQEKNVGPALGQTNRQMGLRAVTIAFLATVVFMAIYYAYNGLIADIALLLNFVITLGVMSFINATFTLPGIAGLILTLGMAVDANVLIFERMREELQRGVSARMAVKLGYEKAFSAIFDSNLTTILTAVILYWVGSEEIRGFGLTLGLGLCISMFTALFVTRQYYYVMVPYSLNQEETRKVWVGTGILALLAGAAIAIGYLRGTDSALYGLGTFLMIMLATAAAMIVTMWAFRTFYQTSGHQKANRLSMMKLMAAPTIDWMKHYRTYWTVSAIVIGGGLLLCWKGLQDSKLLDIEFVGGTSVEFTVQEQYKDMTDEQVVNMIADRLEGSQISAVDWLTQAADRLDAATVTAPTDTSLAVSAEGLTPSQLQALLMPHFEDVVARGAIVPAEQGVTIQISRDRPEAAGLDVSAGRERVRVAAAYARDAAGKLRAARAQVVESTTQRGGKSFEVVTTETNRAIVTEALLNSSLGERLVVTRPVEATLYKDVDRAPDGLFPIDSDANVLADVIGGEASGNSQVQVSNLDRTDYRGGVALVFENLNPPQTVEEISNRLRNTRLSQFENVAWRNFQVVGLKPAEGAPTAGSEPAYASIAILVKDPNILSYDNTDQWRSDLAERELAIAQAALASTQSLQRITQFAPQVATEAAQKAIIAVVLSLILIAVYLWVRFGSAQFGVAGILALYHDVAVSLAAVVGCHYIYDTWFGQMLGVRDFKIDLNIVAALLTIVGFSINDSIVIFDRIRELRGRMATLSPRLLNDAVNQTLSRTILTVFTVLIVVVIMYVWGGDGIKGFAFTMLIGTITGSYSTFAIAVPMVQHQRAMWATTIVIATLTLVGIVLMAVTSRTWEFILCGIVLAGAAYAFNRLVIGHSDAPAPRQPAASASA